VYGKGIQSELWGDFFGCLALLQLVQYKQACPSPRVGFGFGEFDKIMLGEWVVFWGQFRHGTVIAYLFLLVSDGQSFLQQAFLMWKAA
jgi:hypothetical protein